MDVELVLVLVFIFLSKIIPLASGNNITYGRFKVLRPHHQLRQCAERVMRQSEYADGGRISDATNDCEPLFSMSLLRNQKMESGYGYFRLINVQRNFQPPVEIATGRAVMYIPGIMNAGARIDMRLKWPQESWSGIIKLIDAVGNVTAYPSWFYIYIKDAGVKVYFAETYSGFDDYVYDQDGFLASTECKLSFVAQENSIQVLVNDKIIKTKNLTDTRVEQLRYVVIEPPTPSSYPTLLQSFEFSEA